MTKKAQETRDDKYWRKLKNNRLIAVLIVLAGIVIAVASFGDSLQKISQFISPDREDEENMVYKEMKNLFNKIHSNYKEDFGRYLKDFDKGGDPLKIINQLKDDNRLTADDRAKLIWMVKKHINPEMLYSSGPDNTYKLLMDYFGLSDTEYIDSEFVKEKIFYQRWRTSIKDDIENILSEKWKVYFDPGASMRPLSESEVKSKINERWNMLKGPNDKAFDMKKFKDYLIRHSISTKLEECQKLAIKIDKSFDELRHNLSA